MKNRIVIACAVFFAVFLLVVWIYYYPTDKYVDTPVTSVVIPKDKKTEQKPTTSFSAPSSHNSHNPTDNEQQVESTILKELIQQGYGKGAPQAMKAMESFLKSWNPIGRSANELKSTFGNPSVVKKESITYIFDTGVFAWTFEFVLKDDKVIELRRPPSE